MNRSTKKFLYALFFFGVIALVAFLIYFAGQLGGGGSSSGNALPPAPPSLSSRLEIAEQQIFRIREASPAFLFGKVKNPLSDYGFRFSYVFSLYGGDDKLLYEVENEASVFPSSETLLHETVSQVLSRDVYRVSLEIRNAEEVPVYEFPVVSFSFSENPRIEILDEERVIRVLGTVRNDSGTFVPEARVVALLRDAFGFQVFVSGTILANTRSFSEKQFEIPVPYDTDLARQLREGSVEVYFYPVF